VPLPPIQSIATKLSDGADCASNKCSVSALRMRFGLRKSKGQLIRQPTLGGGNRYCDLMASVTLRWTLIDHESAPADELRFAADAEPKAQDLPAAASIELLLRCEIGDEAQLAELVDAVQKRFVGKREVRHWSFEANWPRFGGNVHRELRTLLDALPACGRVTLVGAVSPMLAAIAGSREHRRRVKSLELRNDTALTVIDSLRTLEAMESLQIAGANNVVPPWDCNGFKGFEALREIVLLSIPTLVQYQLWVRQRAWSRQPPTVVIGAVNLPNGVEELNLGSHVRFLPGSFEHARAHWLRLAPVFISFMDACVQRKVVYEVPQGCSAPELMAVLSQQSPITTLDCRACEHLSRWWPSDWLPTEVGLAHESLDEVRLLLPNLTKLRGKGDDVDRACDDTVQRLKALFSERKGQTRVSIEGEVAARLYAWKWFLDVTDSRVNLDLSPPNFLQPLFAVNSYEIDLGQRAHEDFCRLIMRHSQSGQAIGRMRIVGEISASQVDLLRELLVAAPGLVLDLAAQCQGGAEFALVKFAWSFEQRVTISDELEAQFARLDLEKQDYQVAAEWALGGGVN
jgi:hypothetical protein